MTELLRFDGEVVLVTGGGGGLGRAYSLEFARRGARVLVNDVGTDRGGHDRDQAPARDTVAAIRALGGDAFAEYSDAADPSAGDNLVAAALDRWGRVDHVIVNAGIWRDRTIAKMTDDEFDSVLAVHLAGGFRLVRAGLRHMKDAGSGSLLLTTSTAGLYGVVGQANYASAKAGLIGLMRVAALEGQRYGVRANAVVPLAATRSASTHSAGAEFADAGQYPVADVVSLVVALTHSSCPDTGQLLLAGGGWFSRVAVEVADGWQAARASAEDIRQHWGCIAGLPTDREFSDGLAVRPRPPGLGERSGCP